MKKLQRLLWLLIFSLPLVSCLQAQSSFSDCSSARIVCDKNPLSITGLNGSGATKDGFLNTCFPDGFKETNSMWLKWQVAENGLLKFTMLPFDETDDVDFALFRLTSLGNCVDWEPVRCSAAGPNLGAADASAGGCTGATGLNDNAENTAQALGCPQDASNFLRSVEVSAGEYYALFINNYRSNGDLVLEWGGNCKFAPIPEHCQSVSTGVDNPNNSGGGLLVSHIYPNPTANEVAVNINSDHARSCELQIISTSGQIHLSYYTDLSAGENLLKMPVVDLHKGVHFIKIRSEGAIQILRFVKQ